MLFIIPTYNRAHIVSRAIDSVLEQTYENWLSSLDHIKLVRNFNLDEVLALVSELSRLPKEDIQLPTLKDNYQPLVDALTKPFNSKENADTDKDQ